MASVPHLNLLLEVILKTYFFNARCILHLTESANKIDLKTEIPTICVNTENKLNKSLIFRHYGCQGIVITHHDPASIFAQFEKLIRLQNERFNKRQYVIVAKNHSEIFTTIEATYVSDLLVIVYKKNHYDLMTHVFGTTESVLLDKWFAINETFLYGQHLFFDKLQNQNGRILRIGTFSYRPYSIVLQDNETFYGTETNLVVEFMKKYNLTPVLSVIGRELWGRIYPNWTGDGILGTLLYDEVDIGYAAIYTWEEYYNYLDYSKPLTRTGITCLVPAPKLAAGWSTPLRSFPPKMWIALLTIFLLATIALAFILRRYSHKNCFVIALTNVVRIHLLQAATLPLHGFLMKYLIAIILLYIVLMSSSYSSGLSSVMTIPRYEKGIKTVSDLATSGLLWGEEDDAWLNSLLNFQEREYKIIKNRFVSKTTENLELISHSNGFAFPLERLPYGHYAVGSFIKRDVIASYRLMQEDLYWEQCIFIVRKNSVLLSLLDKLILRVLEAGLASYWENQVVAQFMDVEVQRAIKFYTRHTQAHEVVKLKWVHVEGAFEILLLGYCASTSIFFLELLRHQKKKTKKQL